MSNGMANYFGLGRLHRLDVVYSPLKDFVPPSLFDDFWAYYDVLALDERQTIYFRLRICQGFRFQLKFDVDRGRNPGWTALRLLCLGAGIRVAEFLEWDRLAGSPETPLSISALLDAPGPRAADLIMGGAANEA